MANPTPIKRWFFLEPSSGEGKKSHYAAPNPQSANLYLCGWPMDAADDLPPEQVKYRLRVASFSGQELVVHAGSGGKVGTARVKLEGGALPAYAAWCINTAKVMLNEVDPAASLSVVEATPADGEVVDLFTDNRPAADRLADTTPLPQNKPS